MLKDKNKANILANLHNRGRKLHSNVSIAYHEYAAAINIYKNYT